MEPSLGQRYAENEKLIKGYRDYLSHKGNDARTKKTSWMISERNSAADHQLIMEMARLCEENEKIRNQVIQFVTILDDEHTTTTTEVTSKFDGHPRVEDIL